MRNRKKEEPQKTVIHPDYYKIDGLTAIVEKDGTIEYTEHKNGKKVRSWQNELTKNCLA